MTKYLINCVAKTQFLEESDAMEEGREVWCIELREPFPSYEI
tara:strand:- start:5450 stop:5575 length:126 start_codon:yes stop_codon:yes gene_type:complete